jgi:hypothetical protein
MTFVIKPQAPFERLKLAGSCPEVSLNKAIILQAIIDASNTCTSKEATKVANKAKGWLFGASQGLQQTCDFAELDHDYIIKVIAKMLNLHRQSQ